MFSREDDLKSSFARDGLSQALKSFKFWQEQGASEAECLARAMFSYAVNDIVKHRVDMKFGLSHTEKPLEEIYTDIEERYIAIQERNRALAILSNNFEDIDWQGSVDAAEIALFMALVQAEIEGV